MLHGLNALLRQINIKWSVIPHLREHDYDLVFRRCPNIDETGTRLAFDSTMGFV